MPDFNAFDMDLDGGVDGIDFWGSTTWYDTCWSRTGTRKPRMAGTMATRQTTTTKGRR